MIMFDVGKDLMNAYNDGFADGVASVKRESWEEKSCKGCKYSNFILGLQPLPCDHCIRSMVDRYVADMRGEEE